MVHTFLMFFCKLIMKAVITQPTTTVRMLTKTKIILDHNKIEPSDMNQIMNMHNWNEFVAMEIHSVY